MDERELRLLKALVGMVRQYLDAGDDGTVDTQCMCAGEAAITVLAEYGLMEDPPTIKRIGRWTEAGNKFWDSM